MADTSSFEHFDERIAQGLISANQALTGLPQFLDAQIVAITPGTLKASVAVRPELLTPFGSLHGGVMAALSEATVAAWISSITSPLVRVIL